ncbi:MAG: SDR family oxidoreductase [Rhodobacteraceae bacterium]|nr:SDR family oxidoreductase [Paracoccaceae bacterium]
MDSGDSCTLDRFNFWSEGANPGAIGAPPPPLIFLFGKYFVRGWTKGAIKVRPVRATAPEPTASARRRRPEGRRRRSDRSAASRSRAFHRSARGALDRCAFGAGARPRPSSPAADARDRLRRQALRPRPPRISNAGGRANEVSCGPTKTARFQATRTVDPDRVDSATRSLDRYAEPEESADAASFLAGPRAKFINGLVLRVDGSLTLFPG